MEQQENAIDIDRLAFREVVRHPQAHAFVLSRYRLGEHAGVVALKRLLTELQPGARVGRAMQRHYQDEQRHSDVFTTWMQRLHVPPEPLPPEVDGFFFASPEEARQQRALMEQLQPEMRRIVVFAGINAIERLAFNQFEHHLLALERTEDIDVLKGVMKDERFHLSYVEHAIEEQQQGPNGAFVTQAVEMAAQRFADFQQARQQEVRDRVAQWLGGASAPASR